MSFFGFNIAGSALAAFQDAENVTADNIANVQTPGASRQQVSLVQQAPVVGSPFLPTHNNTVGTLGDGVLVNKILRVHQDSYDALFRGATASQGFYDVSTQQLNATQSALGEPNAGINSAYTAFQSAVQQLTSNPTGTPERNSVLSAAGNLVTVINNSGQSILTQEQQIRQQVNQVVTNINNLADQIAALNGQIRASTAAGDNPNTYLDQRDQLVDQLSALVSTQTQLQTSGSALITVGGKALVNDTTVYHLAPPVVGTTANGQPQLVVGFANDPNPANPTPVNIGGAGQLGGYLDVYNNKLLNYKTSLDNFTSTLVSETNRISLAGYDVTGTAGGQIFQPIVAANPIGAGNIKVGIANASEIPAALATTAAGTLVQALNSANNTVDTSSAVLNNPTLANPPAAQVNGTLTVQVDGVSQAVNYQIGGAVPPGTLDASTIDSFINGFNALHYGVSASFDSSSERIVFSRDPSNIDLVHRALVAATPGAATTPDFTVTDSNVPVGTPQPGLGTAGTGLLDTLGAAAISGVNQNGTNAFGAQSAAGANALLDFFTTAYGVPAQQTTSGTAVVPGLNTITVPSAQSFHVGDILTIDAQAGGGVPQENVTVTAVNYNTNQLTFTAVNAHPAGFSITSAQVQTLQNYYSSYVAGLGVDVQTANTGDTSQTSLAANINQVRQGIDGINIDEETQNLIKYQNAYGAAAHLVSILDQMLGVAINLGAGQTSF